MFSRRVGRDGVTVDTDWEAASLFPQNVVDVLEGLFKHVVSPARSLLPKRAGERHLNEAAGTGELK